MNIDPELLEYLWENGKEMSVEEVIEEVKKYPCKS